MKYLFLRRVLYYFILCCICAVLFAFFGGLTLVFCCALCALAGVAPTAGLVWVAIIAGVFADAAFMVDALTGSD